MNYREVLENARVNMAPNCRVCRECNGVACRGEVPGVGGKGTGNAFIVNYEYLQKIKINTDTIYENRGQDSSVSLFGKTFAAPVFAAPIGGMNSNYNGYLTERSYAEALVPGCAKSGCAAFTGDGVPTHFFTDPLDSIRAVRGLAVPTIKPWAKETVYEKMKLAIDAGAMAIAMDIDAAGLPLLAAAGKPVCSKSVEELAEIAANVPVPFILKGIMTVAGAKKAAQCGAYGIVVSNHGGRVIDNTPATMEVLQEIRAQFGRELRIFVDGGFRTGYDVFKALALGADAVLIGRPYVVAACGGGEEGVALYTQKIISELQEAMKMTGCATIKDITYDKVRITK
jgi:isopentenyl diphosphate isomerase/L-lactate dehydrogenase-like FMN-dependent dehydrogenase